MLYNTDLLDLETRTRDTFSLLESMGRINRMYTKPHPTTTPLIESAEYGAFVVRYSDLVKLSEEYDISIQDSLDSLMYTHQLRPNELIVSLEEWRPYVNQNILYEFTNKYVLIPEINTPAYRLCEACMESFLETGDYSWLDFYLECPNFLTESKASKARKRAAMQAQGLDPKGIGNPQQMQSRLAELKSKKEKYEAIANNQNLSPEDRQAATNMIIQTDKAMMSIENNLNKVQNIQKERKSNTAKSEEEIIASMTPEQKKLYLQQKHGTKMSPNNPTPNVSSDNSPSWLSKKWAALKNWWNNAGQADSNGHVGWFSNLVGGFKNLLGIGKPREIHVDPKTGAEMAGDALMNTAKSMQPSQPAEKAAEEAAKKAAVDKQQTEETAKRAADKAIQQATNDQKQDEGKTIPVAVGPNTTPESQQKVKEYEEKKAAIINKKST